MSGKVVLITGASAGIGKETAKKLLAEGYIVYTAARRLESMRDLQELGAIAVQMDISRQEDIEACAAKVIGEQGRIDVLFNNAGFALYGSIEEVSLEDARYQFEVNLFGLAEITRLVLPHMRKQGSGKIISTSSVAGKMHSPLGGWYHASKHALEGWSDCLRVEVKPFGIDVVVIEPGSIDTEFAQVSGSPLLRNSGNGPYRKQAQALSNLHRSSYKPGAASPPSVVADAVVKAIRSEKPRTRYAVGKMAKPSVAMARLLSDKAMDRVIMGMVK
ncbi:oxidoreductase [Saccharibacillus sp. CPCC 101409]|uniref:oxidoreductase n=1 Tax=Saccharibacillus sp. CPCC 101409 TaxID=3058041 RepID=UPI0026719BE8|nr:oxidoreductase [Saccharibacillus sp. CPCC 101409]MDO3410568.1 oxidoreductase [Saccharibacillus sp. CPCC 101409]